MPCTVQKTLLQMNKNTEKCLNCKGRGFVEVGSTTATCKSCEGNGSIPARTMKDYFG